jgi:hypothetical protein
LTKQVNNLNDLSQRLSHEQSQLTEVEGKANQVVSLIAQRSLWPELLQDLTQRLNSNIWVVTFTPQSEAPAAGAATTTGHPSPGVRTHQEPPASGTAANAGKTIGEVRIDGAGVHSAENPERDIQLVKDFVQSLEESSFYDKAGVVIDVPPDPTLQGQTFTFTVRAKLLKPIPL